VAFVIDPSVAGKWFLPDERTVAANTILARIEDGEPAIAPALFTWEMKNLLLFAEREGRIQADEVDDALQVLRDLPILLEAADERFFPGSELNLARALDLTAYDSAYLSTALNRRLELVTADASLAKASRDLEIVTTEVR